MRALTGMCALLLVPVAWGQEPASPAAGAAGIERAAPAAPRPDAAAQAEIDALEPAVAVGNISAVPPTGPVQARTRPAGRETLDLGTTSITGTQELPKVLYIVPWKKSDLGDLAGRPANTLLDEVLAPVDPEVFERHLDYYETLYGDTHEE
jgi:hypothetical protein